MNRITINGQEFEETSEIYPISDGVWYQNKWYKPVEKFKVGDWVMELWMGSAFYNKVPFKVIEINDNVLCYSRKNEITGQYCHEHINRFRKATYQEILEHLRNIAKEKGLVTGVKIKSLDFEKQIETIENYKDKYYSDLDRYYFGNCCLYSNGKWAEKVEEPKFTFGGHEVSFKVFKEEYLNSSLHKVEVTCKGETGTHWEIENILKNYFRPCKFGNVEVKSFELYKKYGNDALPTVEIGKDINFVYKITVGCLTGTYKELYDIYQHCLTLLR